MVATALVATRLGRGQLGSRPVSWIGESQTLHKLYIDNTVCSWAPPLRPRTPNASQLEPEGKGRGRQVLRRDIENRPTLLDKAKWNI